MGVMNPSVRNGTGSQRFTGRKNLSLLMQLNGKGRDKGEHNAMKGDGKSELRISKCD